MKQRPQHTGDKQTLRLNSSREYRPPSATLRGMRPSSSLHSAKWSAQRADA